MYTYILSSLPYLEFGAKPPLPYSDFMLFCKPLLEDMDRLQLDCARIDIESIPFEQVTHPFLLTWIAFENTLRNELVQIRAKSMNVQADAYLRPLLGFHGDLLDLLTQALEDPSPYRVEVNLLSIRWDFLNRQEVGHYFDLAALLVYGLKLQILERMATFEEEKGQQILNLILERNLYGKA